MMMGTRLSSTFHHGAPLSSGPTRGARSRGRSAGAVEQVGGSNR